MKSVEVHCPSCMKLLKKKSLPKHRKMHEREEKGEIKPETKKAVLEPKREPFSYVSDSDPFKILFKKLQGCKLEFKGTQAATPLHFSYKEFVLILDAVSRILEKTESEIQQKNAVATIQAAFQPLLK